MQTRGVERIRAVVALVAAVVLIGWLVQTPADLDDLVEADPTPSATPTAAPEDHQTTGDPQPTGEASTTLLVERVDPATLEPITDSAPQSLDVQRLATGPGAPVLVSDVGSQAVVERVEDLVSPPRRSLLLEGTPTDVAWVGGHGDWLAWATARGAVTLAPLTGPDVTRRVTLPAPAEGLTLIDAALLAEDWIVLFSHDGGDAPLAEGGTAVLWVHVISLELGRTRQIRLGDVPLAGRQALPQHAWDLDAGRLYVLDDVGQQLVSVNLYQVGLSKRLLPTVTAPDGTVRHDWRISADGGQVVVAGIASVDRAVGQPVTQALGLTALDASLRPVAADPTSDAVRAAVSPDGMRVLTSSRVGRIQVLDEDLEVLSEHFAGGVLTDLEFGPDHAYAVRITPTGRVLLSIDLLTAEVVGSRLIGQEARFLPDQGVLLTPVA